MWTLSRNNFRKLLLAAGVSLAPLTVALASPIATVNVNFSTSTNKIFTAGVSTNTAGEQVRFDCFIAGSGIPDASGEVLTIRLAKSGSAQTDGMPSTTFTIQSGKVSYGGLSGPSIPLTFFKADTGLVMQILNAAGTVLGQSDSFQVNAGSATKIVVLAPGQTHAPGRDPSITTNTGKSGSALPQEPNQTFPITVLLTDNQFNKVSANHNVSFASGDLITLPAAGPLSGGEASFNVTITGAKITRTITVSDQTDVSVLAGTAEVTTAGPPAEEVFPFPSPFNPNAGGQMTVQFRLAEPKTVTVKIADQFGQQVWRHESAYTSGTHTTLKWDGKNESGITVASGIYYVFLEIDGSLKSKKRIGVVK